MVLVAKASTVLPSADPLLNLTDKFQTSPLKIGPNKLLAFALILPEDESAKDPEAITKWAKEPLSNLELSIL